MTNLIISDILCVVNTHISDELKKQWPGYEFLGKPFKLKDGKTYMRAYSKFFEKTHIYCFEENFFWHDESPATIKT